TKAGELVNRLRERCLERSHALRTLCRDRDAGVLRLREPQPLVHSGVQRSLRAGLDLRFPAGSLAVWDCGGCLVDSSAAALVAGSEGGLTGVQSSVVSRRQKRI